jgi:hypothetical protein
MLVMVMLIMIVFVGVSLGRMDMLMSVYLVRVLWCHTGRMRMLMMRVAMRMGVLMFNLFVSMCVSVFGHSLTSSVDLRRLSTGLFRATRIHFS